MTNSNLFLATSKYVKKSDKQKAVEEVIDVVGDFAPVARVETVQSSTADESFGISFDMSGLQPVDQSQIPDQSMMMQPELGMFDLFKLALHQRFNKFSKF